jgi:hypothetical protein
MTDTHTLTMTWTLHFSGPLTEKEKSTIIGNLWEHIHNEREGDIPGFAKITRVISPDGKHIAILFGDGRGRIVQFPPEA